MVAHFGLNGDDPQTISAIARRLGANVPIVHKLLDTAGKRIRMEIAPATNATYLWPVKPDEQEGLHEWLPFLGEKEQQVVTAHFGLDGDVPLSQTALALKLGIARPNVSTILKTAGERIRLERAPAARRERNNEINAEEQAGLREWLPYLSPTEGAIVIAHYGLDGKEPKTVKRIAEDRGTSTVSVLNRLHTAEKRIRLEHPAYQGPQASHYDGKPSSELYL